MTSSSRSAPVRSAIVVGAGIAGLMSALALARRGIEVTVLERDDAPPAGIAPVDSMRWLRKGVPQARHPHFFMGRLRSLLAREYPDLLARLEAAGASEARFRDYLHPLGARRYVPQPVDSNLRSINCRRTTFEMTVRDYVREQPGIGIVDACRVTAPLIEAGSPPRVVGVQTADPCTATGTRAYRADAVLDASGRSGKLANALAEAGVTMLVEQHDSGLCYLTRHYRLLPGQVYPESTGIPGAQFDDFILGALPADNGTFTITFQVFRDDGAACRALRDPEHFQAMCTRVGVIAPWVDPARAQATSDVYVFAAMDSFWRRLTIDDAPQVAGFYCVGDAALRTNPKYGRGCTWGSVSAHLLADLLAAPGTDAGRLQAYESALEREFRRDWLTMGGMDDASHAAFAAATGRQPATLATRFSMWFNRHVNLAVLTEPALFREVWSGYHGLQGMADWLRRPQVWPLLLRALWEHRGHRQVLAVFSQRPTHAELAGTD